jgi:hypothetical protein
MFAEKDTKKFETQAAGKQVSMHLCQPSKLSANVRCPVCGQGFLIYAANGIHDGHNINRRIIEHALRSHHGGCPVSSSVHPQSTFSIPSGPGSDRFLASASLSNLLDSAV